MRETLSDTLREYRKQNGYTLEELAEKLQLPLRTVSRWEDGEESPEPQKLVELASLYHITVDALLRFATEAPAAAPSAPAAAPSAPTAAPSAPAEKEKFSEKVKAEGRKIIDGALYPKLARSMFIFPFPIFVVIAYVCAGFFAHKWGYPSFLLFLTIPMYYMIAAACRTTGIKGFLMLMPVPIVVVMVYLILGMSLSLWHPGWLVFLLIPLYYWFVLFAVKKKK